MNDTNHFPPSAPVATVVKRKPSTGVVLAAIALGVVSLAMLLFAVLMAIGGVMLGHAPQAQVAPAPAIPGAIPPSQAAMVAFAMVFALAMLSGAVWGAATVVGLLRLKAWARVSIMILGGILAVLGLFGVVGAAFTPMVMKTMALPPTVNAAQLKIVFAAVAAFWGITALIGAWWIVYFAMKHTGAVFAPSSTPLAPGGAPPRLAPRPTGPLTDFTVAQPLPPSEPEDPEW